MLAPWYAELLMKARIRGAAVIVHEQQIVLARHSDAQRGLVWWSPPGGGVENEESILICAEREAREETSLRVVAERPIYAQELIDLRRNSRTLELFILCHLAEGVTPADLRADNEIEEARFFTVALAPTFQSLATCRENSNMSRPPIDCTVTIAKSIPIFC